MKEKSGSAVVLHFSKQNIMAEWKGWRWREWRQEGDRKGAKARQKAERGKGREDSALEGGWVVGLLGDKCPEDREGRDLRKNQREEARGGRGSGRLGRRRAN